MNFWQEEEKAQFLKAYRVSDSSPSSSFISVVASRFSIQLQDYVTFWRLSNVTGVLFVVLALHKQGKAESVVLSLDKQAEIQR